MTCFLYESGQTSEIYGAFYRSMFGKGGPCWLPLTYPDPVEAVRAIKADGGFAVLAHPNEQKNLDLVPRLAEAGLDGVELHHPDNDSGSMDEIQRICSAYGLMRTGGSDYHGSYSGARFAAFLAEHECERIFR